MIKPITQHAQLHCLSDIVRRISTETTISADGDADLRQTSRPHRNHIIAFGSNALSPTGTLANPSPPGRARGPKRVPYTRTRPSHPDPTRGPDPQTRSGPQTRPRFPNETQFPQRDPSPNCFSCSVQGTLANPSPSFAKQSQTPNDTQTPKR